MRLGSENAVEDRAVRKRGRSESLEESSGHIEKKPKDFLGRRHRSSYTSDEQQFYQRVQGVLTRARSECAKNITTGNRRSMTLDPSETFIQIVCTELNYSEYKNSLPALADMFDVTFDFDISLPIATETIRIQFLAKFGGAMYRKV